MTTDKPADSSKNESKEQHSYEDLDTGEVRMADPLDLVYKGGFSGNPREIVENPAVAPEMLDNMTELNDHLRRDSE